MSTVGNLVDRIYREALSRPDAEPTQTTLAASLSNVATTVTISPFALPEEGALLGAGVVLEVDVELMRVLSYDGVATLTVVRGVRGTTALAHNNGAPLYLAPAYSRQAVFDAVADSIVGLYPDLWRVATEHVDPVALSEITDPNAQTLISVRYLNGSGWHETIGEILFGLEDEVSEGTLALSLPPACWDLPTYVTYRGSFARPTSEAATFASMGLDEAWARLLIIDTVAYLVALLGPDAVRSEFITDALEESSRGPNEEQSLAVAMVRLRQIYLTRHKKSLERAHRPRTRMRAAY